MGRAIDLIYDKLTHRNFRRLDISIRRLATARRRNQVAGTQFVEMNAEKLDFPDASFDKILSLCVIEHFDDDEKVLAEAARVLVPGGRLVFSADSLSNPEFRQPSGSNTAGATL